MKEHTYTDKEIIALVEKELDSIRDQLNTEKHLVRVYKIQAMAANEQFLNSNELIKEMREALILAVFYLQDKGLDLTKLESLIEKANK